MVCFKCVNRISTFFAVPGAEIVGDEPRWWQVWAVAMQGLRSGGRRTLSQSRRTTLWVLQWCMGPCFPRAFLSQPRVHPPSPAQISSILCRHGPDEAQKDLRRHRVRDQSYPASGSGGRTATVATSRHPAPKGRSQGQRVAVWFVRVVPPFAASVWRALQDRKRPTDWLRVTGLNSNYHAPC